MNEDGVVTRRGFLDMQVCVPSEWDDARVKEFADHGWHIRKQGSKYLSGADERVQCSKFSDRVHIMLDA